MKLRSKNLSTSKIKNPLTNFAFVIFFVFALIGALTVGTILHEYSHMRDYQAVNPSYEEIIISVPTDWRNLHNLYGAYFFAYEREYNEKVEQIDRYTEVRAYAMTFSILAVFLISFFILMNSRNSRFSS